MKLKVIMIIIVTLLFVGCQNKNIEQLPTVNEEKLKAQLQEYARDIFDNAWTGGGIKEGTYTFTLGELEEYNFDTSMFKNSKDKKCDPENTKIEFIVNKQIVPDKTNYELKYYIDCDFK